MKTAATEASRFPHGELRRAAALSLIPAGFALAFGVLLLPRRATPDAVPLPIADPRGVLSAASSDRELAALARREPLAPAVRALGSALREFHLREAKGADDAALAAARRDVDRAYVEALAMGSEPLLRLRAAELEAFDVEISAYERTGVESEELRALAGGFLRTMAREGWLTGTRFAPNRDTLRVMYKEMWAGFLGLAGQAPFALSVDEVRTLYAFYLLHPHAASPQRSAIAAARRGARTAVQCQALDEAERSAVEGWRIERIARLSALDPAYPAAYARGVASLRRGDFKAAEASFRDWLDHHPDGPYALRARTYLRSALAAARVP